MKSKSEIKAADFRRETGSICFRKRRWLPSAEPRDRSIVILNEILIDANED